ncbi:MAG: bifunctional folylpolyglutamate synthase/dihydrofolate synthase [Thermodesulfobacteriota bacterium]
MNPEKEPFEYLRSLSLHKVKPGIERISALMKSMGNPHLAPETVLVAGTNGKTSTASILAEILSSCGFSTGLYTSPHLLSVGERIRINGLCAPDAEIGNLIERVREMSVSKNIDASYFETLTAVAFIYFKERKTDFAVLETGMGGRWDATNIARPLVCAITNVSIDHTKYLGDTEEKIAEEKAGIIKPETPLVTAASGAALEVIERVCAEKNSPVFRNRKEFESSENGDGTFSFSGRKWEIKNIRLAMEGDFQITNTAVALACAEALACERGVEISPGRAKEAAEKTRIEARMEYARVSPPFIIDGAHNTEAARRLAESLMRKHPEQKFVFVTAMSDDKDHAGFVEEIARVCSRLIITRSESGKGAEPEKIMNAARGKTNVEIEENPVRALEKASGSPCCVTGSLYFAGEVKDLIARKLFSIQSQECTHGGNP